MIRAKAVVITVVSVVLGTWLGLLFRWAAARVLERLGYVTISTQSIVELPSQHRRSEDRTAMPRISYPPPDALTAPETTAHLEVARRQQR